MFNMRRAGDLMILQSDLLPVSLRHAFTTRRMQKPLDPDADNGVPNFRFDSIEETAQWWLKLRGALYTPKHICFAHQQIHSGIVRVVDPENPPGEEKEVGGFRFRILGEGDAIIRPFSRVQSFLAITTADCLPCIVYEPNSGAVGVVHAGWRGMAADIVGAAVKAMQSEMGLKPKDLFWAVGPAIDGANYEVGREVIAAFETAGYAESDWQSDHSITPGWRRTKQRDHYLLNLSACVQIRLRNLGVPDNQVDICKLSTYGNANLFFSCRRDGGVKGLQATVIG